MNFVYRYAGKKSLKITHASIHAMAFVFTVFGLVSVFDSHNYAVPKIPNLYSLHSWVGVLAVGIFFCQYVFGFFSFLFPKVKENLRIMYMPIHIFFGLLGFLMALIAVLMGLNEKAFFAMKDYENLPSHGLMINSIGMLVILFGSCVIYLVTEPSYKREALPEDSMLLTGAQE